MEQTSKPTFGQIATLGLFGALSFGAAHYLRVGVATPLEQAFAEVLATIGWLLLIASVILMVLWAAKSLRS